MGAPWYENHCPKGAEDGEARVQPGSLPYRLESAFLGSSTDRTWGKLRSWMSLGGKNFTWVGVALTWSPLAQSFRTRHGKLDSFGLKSWLRYLIAVWPWSRSLSSPGPVYKIRIIIVIIGLLRIFSEIVSLKQGFFFFFWLHNTACRISVLQLGIKPMPPSVEVQSPNHWTTREFP